MTSEQELSLIKAMLLEERRMAAERLIWLDKVCFALGLIKQREFMSSRERGEHSPDPPTATRT